MPISKGKGDLLRGARVYLSGPMDFVVSRAAEKQSGWRNRVGEFLAELGVTVFDPWFKPDVRGLYEYGREDVKSGERIRERWTYAGGGEAWRRGAVVVRRVSFGRLLHIDLRMVDTSDFNILFARRTSTASARRTRSSWPPCSTSRCCSSARLLCSRRCTSCAPICGTTPRAGVVAAVGTGDPHQRESAAAFPAYGISRWLGGENFFDGFGFAAYRKRFGWREDIPIDRHEKRFPPKRPLLPFVEKLNKRLPKKWDSDSTDSCPTTTGCYGIFTPTRFAASM